MKEYKKYIDAVSDSTMQLTSKNLPLVEFWYSIKEKHPQLSLKTVKKLLVFLTIFLHMARFPSYQNNVSQQTEWRNIWESSCLLLKQSLEICKFFITIFFCFGKYFSCKSVILLTSTRFIIVIFDINC